jgi:hypothetical protein
MMTSQSLSLLLGITADEVDDLLMAFEGMYATIEDLWKEIPFT